MDEIPEQLVINWDQTGIHYVTVSSWMMDKEGRKRIGIVGADDKRQLTAVFGESLAGDFVPPQLVYKQKTQWCLPSVHHFQSQPLVKRGDHISQRTKHLSCCYQEKG